MAQDPAARTPGTGVTMPNDLPRCRLTRNLPRVWAYQDLLVEHLNTCDSCRRAGRVIDYMYSFRTPGAEAGRTELCPPDSLFTEMDLPPADLEAEDAVASHVLTCPYCLSRIRPVGLDRSEAERLIQVADENLHSRMGGRSVHDELTQLRGDEYAEPDRDEEDEDGYEDDDHSR